MKNYSKRIKEIKNKIKKIKRTNFVINTATMIIDAIILFLVSAVVINLINGIGNVSKFFAILTLSNMITTIILAILYGIFVHPIIKNNSNAINKLYEEIMNVKKDTNDEYYKTIYSLSRLHKLETEVNGIF